jgi:hypothetical protein
MTEPAQEYPRYEKKFGSYYLMGSPPSALGNGRIITMTDIVAIAFDISVSDGSALLLKHGSPTNVEKYVQEYRKRLLNDGDDFSRDLAAAIRSITLSPDFDVEEINHCLHISGYLTVMLRKHCPEALSL